MAEKAAAKKPRSRAVKDAGQRVVFAGLEMEASDVANLLASAASQEPSQDAIKAAALLLGAENGSEAITVWVQLGKPVDGSPAKRDAVNVVVGTDRPGRYRAPTSTAWRGEIRRTPPKQVSLDEEVVD